MLMKILFLAILICSSFLFPSSSFASHVELKPCVEIAHCVREEWEVNNNIEKPLKRLKHLSKTLQELRLYKLMEIIFMLRQPVNG